MLDQFLMCAPVNGSMHINNLARKEILINSEKKNCIFYPIFLFKRSLWLLFTSVSLLYTNKYDLQAELQAESHNESSLCIQKYLCNNLVCRQCFSLAIYFA